MDSKRFKLETPAIDDNEVVMDAVETSLGWLSFALTNKGLKRSTLMYKSRTDALSSLKRDKIQGTLTVNDTDFSSLIKPWTAFFEDLLSDKGKIPAADVPIDDTGWTTFAKKVYCYLLHLPRGESVTYGEIAVAVGHPGAARAVGGLMKNNPIPPLVPCHRVLGSGGKLTGFSASGGLQLKQSMLKIEGIVDVNV